MSTIEWTDKTWNPVTGCSKVSAGCKNCYAEAIADRFFAKQYATNPDGSNRKFTDVRCHPDRLMQPLSWKPNTNCFVNSMSDLFHEDVPDQFITDIFAVMFLAHWVRFQVLTKRAERMLAYLSAGDHGIFEQFTRLRDPGRIVPKGVSRALSLKTGDLFSIGQWPQWPLPNVWLGVSVENQKYANERILPLLQTPAAVRFLSVEPQLEAIDLTNLECKEEDCRYLLNSLTGVAEVLDSNSMDIISDDPRNPKIDWVICGGESGPGARPFNLAWAESLLGQCKSAGIPFFMKQIGSNPSGPAHLVPHIVNTKGGDPADWPEALRVREWPRGNL